MPCLDGRLMLSSWRGRIMFIRNSRCRVIRGPSPHGSRKVALECEEGDAAHAESVCATEELKFYKDNVDPAVMTLLKKPTTEHDPALKFKSADETKLVDFVPGDSSKQFSVSANLDPK